MPSKAVGKVPQAGGSSERHLQYYIPSGDVVFLVENTLFRVHRYFLLRESPLFRDMLSLPGSTPEGDTDECPIVLPQVTSEEFAHFLWIFYNPKYSEYEANIDKWAMILRLAHLWQCNEIRDLVFRELDNLVVPPVERVLLTMKYDARTEWREKALADLGARPKPLSIEDGRQLGLELSICVAELRERIRERERRQNFTDEPGRVRCAVGVEQTPVTVASWSPDSPRIVQVPPGRTRSPSTVYVHPAYIYSPQDLEDVRAVFPARML